MATVWKTVDVTTRTGDHVKAMAPIIISASRSTDIPKFYSEWLCNRLDAGYCVWVNPFNGSRHYVSFREARVFVFWSKDPAPLLPYLHRFDTRGIGYYFQFTLNDYDAEKYEPGVPKLVDRLKTFRELSRCLNNTRVVWRSDPLLITDRTPPEKLLEKVVRVGDELAGLTERLVLSFADIATYPKVERTLRAADIGAREFTLDEMRDFARQIAAHARRWGMEVRTCAETTDLREFGVLPNKCIDDELLVKWFPRDAALMQFLGVEQDLLGTVVQRAGVSLKDKGQRKACGCIVSKDIGHYNTCPHLCIYCYANSGRECVKRGRDPNAECILD